MGREREQIVLGLEPASQFVWTSLPPPPPAQGASVFLSVNGGNNQTSLL